LERQEATKRTPLASTNHQLGPVKVRIRRVDREEPIGNWVGNKLVIDNASIVVVDNAVFTDEELGGLGFFHLSI